MIRSLVTAAALAIVVSVEARAAVVGIPAMKDATIFQNNANNGSGGGNGLFAGTNGTGSPRRALIAFDVAAWIPSNVVVHQVELTLVLGQVAGSGVGGSGGGAEQAINLHRVSNSWDEGATQKLAKPNDSLGGMGQGAAAADGDVTWHSRSQNIGPDWTAAGGDFDPTPIASATVGTVTNVGYAWQSTAALVNDVREWLDLPSSNFGWILVNTSEAATQSFRAFYSRDVATTAYHPMLSVTYEVVSEPAPGDFNDDGTVNGADLAQWQGDFGPLDDGSDADGDGDSDGADYLTWQRHVSVASVAATDVVPEPPASLLLAISLPFIIRRCELAFLAVASIQCT